MTPDGSGAAGVSARGGSRAAQQARAAATRAALIVAGRSVFAQAGFHAARAVDIVKAAAVTRGALYHHFADKEALFEAVLRDVAAELNARTQAASNALAPDLWAQIVFAFRAYLDLVATQPDYRRILLLDGPVVLGWQRWRDVQSDYVAQGTADALLLLMDRGLMARRAAGPLAHLIQAALNDAALSIAHAPPGSDTGETVAAFLFLLDRLRAPSGIIA